MTFSFGEGSRLFLSWPQTLETLEPRLTLYTGREMLPCPLISGVGDTCTSVVSLNRIPKGFCLTRCGRHGDIVIGRKDRLDVSVTGFADGS